MDKFIFLDTSQRTQAPKRNFLYRRTDSLDRYFEYVSRLPNYLLTVAGENFNDIKVYRNCFDSYWSYWHDELRFTFKLMPGWIKEFIKQFNKDNKYINIILEGTKDFKVFRRREDNPFGKNTYTYWYSENSRNPYFSSSYKVELKDVFTEGAKQHLTFLIHHLLQLASFEGICKSNNIDDVYIELNKINKDYYNALCNLNNNADNSKYTLYKDKINVDVIKSFDDYKLMNKIFPEETVNGRSEFSGQSYYINKIMEELK